MLISSLIDWPLIANWAKVPLQMARFPGQLSIFYFILFFIFTLGELYSFRMCFIHDGRHKPIFSY